MEFYIIFRLIIKYQTFFRFKSNITVNTLKRIYCGESKSNF